MKYYKILRNQSLIGVVNSGNFVRENQNHRLFYTDEEQGCFINYDGILYRDFWMIPLYNSTYDFLQASIIEISQEAYDAYISAMASNETIPEEEEEEEEIPPTPTPTPETPDQMLEYIRESKLSEMSRACRTTIESGFDLELRGETHHFSLTTQDQLNLMSLSTTATTQDLIPYHADDETCVFYTADEIKEIAAKAAEFKNYNLAYYNSLKTYINALETIEEVSAITYGTPIPEEYKSDVLKVLEY